MGKVRNRLPLSLGMVFFPRRTPLRAIVEAGRSMLRGFHGMDEKPQEWLVDGTDGPLAGAADAWPPVLNLRLSRQGKAIPVSVDLRMGDASTRDVWYPYWHTANGELKHVRELAVGDRVQFRPSHLDFEFLDTTARRFELQYGEGRRLSRRSRPFLLDDWDSLGGLWTEMRNLEKSQRYQVISSIEATREAWFGADPECRSWTDPVFHRFVRDTLAGALWPKTRNWKAIQADGLDEQLVRIGVTGELADLAELHMEILKN